MPRADEGSIVNISVFGLGKVGLTLTSCLATAGYRTVGVDPAAGIVEAVRQRAATTPEPGVMERLAAVPADRVWATTDAAEAVAQTDVSFIIVPTPSNTLGGFSNRFIIEACESIGRAMRAKTTPHCVAVVSTMLPGSSKLEIIPALERASGRRLGDGLGYAYNPSFIALGEVVKGIEMPDYVLIGEADAASGDLIQSIHARMVRNEAPASRMSPVEAEIAKIASNTHETMRVSFANMLFALCAEVPGANVDRITEALTYRLGRRFFRGAVPYGGPCWPRDNRALSAFMNAVGVPSRLPHTVDLVNEEHGEFILRKVLGYSKPGESVGILGLAYKPGTPMTERAYGVDLARWLAREGRRVVAWDPLAMPSARADLGDAVAFAETAEACLRESRVAVIINPLAELKTIDWRAARETTVVDCWRGLSPEAAGQAQLYIPLGSGRDVDWAEWIDGPIGRRLGLLTN